MKTISYIAMIATAAFCQLSSCMNQPNNPVNGNQSSPAACTFDMWTVKVPVGFSVMFGQADDRVAEVDFDTKKVHVPYMPNLSVFCTGPEVMGSTSLSIDNRRFPQIPLQTDNPRALLATYVDMRPLHFIGKFVQTGNRAVEVDFRTKEARVPSGQNIQFSVSGSEWNTSLSIVHQYPNFSTIQNVTQHASPTPLEDMRQPLEMKEEKEQERIDSQKKTESDSDLFEIREMKEEKTQEKKESQKNTESDSDLFEIREMKEEKEQEKKESQIEREIDSERSKILKESKRPKTPKNLKKIENSNSHTKEVDKKKAKQTDKIDREYFLNKYDNEPLDDGTKERIRFLYNGEIKSATKILDELLTPPMPKKERQVLIGL